MAKTAEQTKFESLTPEQQNSLPSGLVSTITRGATLNDPGWEKLNSFKGTTKPAPMGTVPGITSTAKERAANRTDRMAVRSDIANTAAQEITARTGQEMPNTIDFTPQARETVPVALPRRYDEERAIAEAHGITNPTSEQLALLARQTYTQAELDRLSEGDRQALGVGETVYNPEQLAALGLSQEQIASLSETGGAANQAFAGQMQIGDPNSALGVLQEALNLKSNVTDQKLGTSNLFAQAGLPTSGTLGAAILGQSLGERSAEIGDKINGFRKRVNEGAGSLSDTLKKYELTRELFEDQKNELLKINELTQAFERQLELKDRQFALDKDLATFRASLSGKEFIKGDGTNPSGIFNSDTGEFTPVSTQGLTTGGNLVAPTATAVYMGSSKNGNGVDYAGSFGSPINASHGGTVLSVENVPGWGLQVKVEDKEGNVHQYSHLSEAFVTPGQTIGANQKVGGMGNSGDVLTYDQGTQGWRDVTAEERAAGKGTHLDYTVYKPDGTPYSVQEAAEFAQVGETPPLSEIGQAVWDGMVDLKDLTPTIMQKVLGELNEAGYKSVVSKEIKQTVASILLEIDDVYDAWEKIPDINKGLVHGFISNISIAEGRVPEITTFNTKAGIIGQSIARLFEKGRMSDEDRIFYLSRLPSIYYSNPKSAKAAVEAMKDQLNTKIQDTALENWRIMLEEQKLPPEKNILNEDGQTVRASDVMNTLEFTGTSKSDAISALESKGWPVTEANINKLLNQ